MKKVDFLFQYEVKQRELDAICLIAAYLRNKGYITAIVNSWESMYSSLPLYDAEVMVVSACYNSNVYNAFTGIAGRFRKVLDMHWEEVLFNKAYLPQAESFHDYKGNGLITRHVCWGENAQKWLNDYWKIPPQYTRVVGFPSLDLYRPELRPQLIPREQLFKEFGLDPNKLTILFVSSFATINLPDTEIFEDKGGLQEQICASVESRKILLDWFCRFAEAHPDVQLIYRFHPAEKNDGTINALCEKYPNFFAVSKYAIHHWFSACDKLINWHSTSIIDMYYSKKDTYILRPVALPWDWTAIVFNDAKYLTTYEEFDRILDNYDGFPVPEDTLLGWYSITETPTYKRLGDWLIETYQSEEYLSPATEGVSRHNILTQKAINAIKYNSLLPVALKLISSIAPQHPSSKKIKKLEEDLAEAKAHRKEMMNPHGYMYEKYIQNRMNPAEVEEKISIFQKLIAQNC